MDSAFSMTGKFQKQLNSTDKMMSLKRYSGKY